MIKQVNIRLAGAEHEALTSLARLAKVSPATLARRVVEVWLDSLVEAKEQAATPRYKSGWGYRPFERAQGGYQVTEQDRALVEQAVRDGRVKRLKPGHAEGSGANSWEKIGER